MLFVSRLAGLVVALLLVCRVRQILLRVAGVAAGALQLFYSHF